jgi:CheY-like chemotaxis protein
MPATISHRSRVLLVEDEFLICEMLVDALTEHGFEVHAVANAEDALQHLARGEPCDVLFTDINLSGGIDGAVLSRLARDLRPGLPVVYASGSVATLADLQAVPGASFVPKPYDPDKVCSMLSRIAAP